MAKSLSLSSSRTYLQLALAGLLALAGPVAYADFPVPEPGQAKPELETRAESISSNPGQGASESERGAATSSSSSSSSSSKQCKVAADEECRYLSIPLLFMTDRLVDNHNKFGNGRKNESNSIYDVYCGSVNYTLSNSEKKNLTDSRKALGWNARSKPGKIAHELMNLPVQPTDTLDKFGESLVEYARKTGQNEIFVFVHGFNNTFESSAKCAALLAYQTERPVVLYSWPSTAKVLQYFVDSGNNEWSQEHFNRFAEMLSSLKEKYGIHINVVAHSMGNRLVVRAAPVLEGKRLFNQVFLVDPDFDSQTFIHYVARYANKKEIGVGKKLCILFSHKDNALPLAQMLFGGYTRLGQGADTIVESLFKPSQVMPAVVAGTITALSSRKNGVAESNEGAAHNLFRKELEWIDFTALDHGVIGHSIPYKLIANLSQTAKPGAGLAFEPVEVGVSDFKDKLLTRYFGNKKQCSPLGVCKRVVFSDIADTVPVLPLAENGSSLSSTQ